MIDSPFPQPKKKKVDYEALSSAFMKIPRMDVNAARDLLDLGFREIFELSGRCPESIFNEISEKRAEEGQKKDSLPKDRLNYFRMAVYFAETDDPDPRLLHKDAWA